MDEKIKVVFVDDEPWKLTAEQCKLVIDRITKDTKLVVIKS
jgi:hypothetical protein